MAMKVNADSIDIIRNDIVRRLDSNYDHIMLERKHIDNEIFKRQLNKLAYLNLFNARIGNKVSLKFDNDSSGVQENPIITSFPAKRRNAKPSIYKRYMEKHNLRHNFNESICYLLLDRLETLGAVRRESNKWSRNENIRYSTYVTKDIDAVEELKILNANKLSTSRNERVREAINSAASILSVYFKLDVNKDSFNNFIPLFITNDEINREIVKNLNRIKQKNEHDVTQLLNSFIDVFEMLTSNAKDIDYRRFINHEPVASTKECPNIYEHNLNRDSRLKERLIENQINALTKLHTLCVSIYNKHAFNNDGYGGIDLSYKDEQTIQTARVFDEYIVEQLKIFRELKYCTFTGDHHNPYHINKFEVEVKDIEKQDGTDPVVIKDLVNDRAMMIYGANFSDDECEDEVSYDLKDFIISRRLRGGLATVDAIASSVIESYATLNPTSYKRIVKNKVPSCADEYNTLYPYIYEFVTNLSEQRIRELVTPREQLDNIFIRDTLTGGNNSGTSVKACTKWLVKTVRVLESLSKLETALEQNTLKGITYHKFDETMLGIWRKYLHEYFIAHLIHRANITLRALL